MLLRNQLRDDLRLHLVNVAYVLDRTDTSDLQLMAHRAVEDDGTFREPDGPEARQQIDLFPLINLGPFCEHLPGYLSGPCPVAFCTKCVRALAFRFCTRVIALGCVCFCLWLLFYY